MEAVFNPSSKKHKKLIDDIINRTKVKEEIAQSVEKFRSSHANN